MTHPRSTGDVPALSRAATFVGLLASSLAATMLVAASALLRGVVASDPGWLGAALLILLFGLPFAAGAAVLIALPVLALLRRAGRESLRTVLILGAVTGILVSSIARGPALDGLTSGLAGLMAAGTGWKAAQWFDRRWGRPRSER